MTIFHTVCCCHLSNLRDRVHDHMTSRNYTAVIDVREFTQEISNSKTRIDQCQERACFDSIYIV
jgi:hypothetical protein